MAPKEMLLKKKTKLVMDLVKGKEYANQLQALFHNKPFGDEGLVLAEELVKKVLKSFTKSLAEVNKSCASSSTDEICQIEAVAAAAAADHVFSAAASSGDLSFHDFDRSSEKDQRGVYKRSRRAAESWVIVSPSIGDGYAWRKYGQKEILNSIHPRCYFRCTHKYAQGCQATKQVQKIDQKQTIVYKTTYFGNHTCKDTKNTSIIISDPEYPIDSNLLSFQETTPTKNHVHPCSYNNSKYESKEETQSDLTVSSILQNFVASGSSDQPSAAMDLSQKMGSFHEEVVSSVYSSAESTSLHGLDMNTFSKFVDFNKHDFTFDDDNHFF